MKKIFSILMAVIAVVTVSCNNDKLFEEQGVPAGSIRVNIKVGGLQPSTKAVKTGWENGDIINIWFDNKVFQTPELTMTYNNGSWVASEISNEVAGQLKSNGTIWGFYEASNSATTAWTFNNGEKPGLTAIFDTPGSNWQTGAYGYLTACFQEIDYTYDGTTLSANLNNWFYGTDIQIVITGLDQTKTWTLKVPGIDNWMGIQMWLEGADHDQFNMWYSLGGSNYPMYGVPNADGLAFYGKFENQYTNSTQDYTFTLKNVTDNITYTFTKNAQISTNYGTSLFAVKVPFNKFVVDMGLSVKWAACNLGADYITDYGDHFAWGVTTPYYSSLSPLTWKDGKTAGYDWDSYPWTTDGGSTFTKYNGSDYNTLQSTDDAATAAYGSSYHIPTSDQFEELLDPDNCDKEWVTDYLGSGVNGYLFTSKKDGKTCQKVFFPAAGEYFKTNLYSTNTLGIYWSSSLKPDETESAWYFQVESADAYVTRNYRYDGLSVRPVSD